MQKIINIAIFASGSGTNAEKIIQYFQNNERVKVSCIVCNNSNAGVISKAETYSVDYLVIDKDYLSNRERFLQFLSEKKVDFIVLAGFLWLIPEYLIYIYTDKIVNIHPALLPKYGGKGMYGMNVHREVVKNNETETGISIHLVNKKYDEGDIIFQAKTDINKNDTPSDIALKVQKLEHKYYPEIIEKMLIK